MGYWVYILECENGSLYTGSTDNVVKRYCQHVTGRGGARFTRSFKPRRIAGSWRIPTSRGDAARAEKAVQKLTRNGKDSLLKNPHTLVDILRSAGYDFPAIPADPDKAQAEAKRWLEKGEIPDVDPFAHGDEGAGTE